MAIDPQQLVTRTPVLDRNQDIAFQRMQMAAVDPDVILPLMLHLSNVQNPLTTLFLPMEWVTDEVLLEKLARNTVLVTDVTHEVQLPLLQRARNSGFRIASTQDVVDNSIPAAEFRLVSYDSGMGKLSPDSILIDIETPEEFRLASSGSGMYFSGNIAMLPEPPASNKRSNPAHAVILELMSAVQNESSPKDIEAIFKRDVTLSFKLLRYINSPWFGLASRIESVRHALSILGFQPLLKWLALLAATAGQATSPAITQTVMIRARLMELVGSKKLDRRDADNLFLTGMLSLLDRIMGVPLAEILSRANLPPAIAEALLQGEGKYKRFLDMALACEGLLSTEDAMNLPDLDVRAVNTAHMEAIEWAAQISGT